MSRMSTDELDETGHILNGYDYRLQVWVRDGVIQDVGQGGELVGRLITDVPGAEVRHTADEQCDVDPATDCCRVCGVLHGEPCRVCGARGYHRADCPELEEI